MKKLFALSCALSLLALIGCGGDTRPRTSSVTGAVVDANFNPVRGATVSALGGSTKTSETGAYQLTGIADGEVEVTATLSANGTNYRGRTWVFNSENEQQRSANIVIAPVGELATLKGTVFDRDGFRLQGATVFAYMGSGSSARIFTDKNGNFTMRDMIANVNYSISASGQGYRSDQLTLVLAEGQTRTLNFTLSSPGLPALDPPQNVGITSWVSWPGDGRATDAVQSIDWMKAHMDKGKDRKFVARTRALRSDMQVEAELFWDQQQFPDLFGFGVYRANSFSAPLTSLDFYFDPLSPYYQDVGLNPNSSYSYALTTIATLFPDFSNQTESDFSERVNINTLNLLRVNPVTFSPVRFNWQNGSGATDFVVYLFDRYPSVNVDSIWTNESNPATGNGAVYDGPNLQSGRTYYYIVLGGADGFTARTISPVKTFIR